MLASCQPTLASSQEVDPCKRLAGVTVAVGRNWKIILGWIIVSQLLIINGPSRQD